MVELTWLRGLLTRRRGRLAATAIGGAHGTAKVKVDGVVDLPAADSLFQQVGAPVGAQAQAPPDNVILLPAPLFQRLEGTGVTQIHAALDHRLPGSPASAFSAVN